MARRKKGRLVNGVLVLDKPTGITSNGALQQVRKFFDAQKGGHTGALDPLATGVLPLCFGEATKFSKYLLNADKSYETTARLGVITDSGDSDGQVVEERPVPLYTPERINEVVDAFKGKIFQTPSMFSALKHQGRPLYELARKGIEVERKAREIEIYTLEILDVRPEEIDLRVSCSKGTYIRSLVEDIGLMLGCGAHVTMLRRIQAGHFSLDGAYCLDELTQLIEKDEKCAQKGDFDTILMPIDQLLTEYPEIRVNSDQLRSLSHGQTVKIEPSFLSEPCVRMYHGEKFLGVGRITDTNELVPTRLVVFES